MNGFPEKTFDQLIEDGDLFARISHDFGYNRYRHSSKSYKKALKQKPCRADIWYKLATTYRMMGETKKSIKAFEHVLVLEPQNIKGWFGKGRELFQAGRYADAVESFDQVIVLDPHCYRALSFKGDLLRILGKYQEALNVFDSFPFPDKTNIHLLYADCLSELGRYSEAFDRIDAIHAKNQGNAHSWSDKGDLLARLGRTQDAAEAYETALKIFPDHKHTWYKLGWVYRTLNNNEKSHRAFFNTFPEKIFADSSRGPWGSLNLHQRQTEEFNRIVQDRTRILSEDPHNIKAWCDKGYAHYTLEQLPQAIDAWENAGRIDPDFLWPSFARGVALHISGKFTDAIREYSSVLAKDPEILTVWFNQGYAYLWMKQYDEAVESFDQVLRINPNHYDSLIEKAEALNSLGKYEEALITFGLAKENNPGGIVPNRSLWSQECEILISMERYQEALNLCASMKREYPVVAVEAFEVAGDILMCLGNYDEACTAYSIADSRVHTSDDILAKFGQESERGKLSSTSIRYLSEALIERPDYEAARVLLKLAIDAKKRGDSTIPDPGIDKKLLRRPYFMWF